MTLKPVIIDTRFLRALPKALFRSPCEQCDKRQSMWEMGPPDGDEQHIVCSLCFLYESNWGKSRRAELDELIKAVETEVNGAWLRDPEGRLLSCPDGDRILASIALTSRAFQMEDRMKERTADLLVDETEVPKKTH